ncbi:leucine-rich repeat domain-containing protein [Sulfitobacter sp.]|uniref:leucine-rich repeat domain-containing protein n=1 Tax=Sulfitobacter sp. TaxID=1903071 RepID=UPI0035658B04
MTELQTELPLGMLVFRRFLSAALRIILLLFYDLTRSLVLPERLQCRFRTTPVIGNQEVEICGINPQYRHIFLFEWSRISGSRMEAMMQTKRLFAFATALVGLGLIVFVVYASMERSSGHFMRAPDLSDKGHAFADHIDRLASDRTSNSPLQVNPAEIALINDAISERPDVIPQCTKGGLDGLAFSLQCVTKDSRHMTVLAGEFPWLKQMEGYGNITSIRIQSVKTDTLDILARFPDLRTVEIVDSDVGDASALASHTQLQKLTLTGTISGDLSFLRALPDLTGLWLNGLQTADLSPISDLTKLTELAISGAAISDISALSRLSAVKELTIDVPLVRDVTPLANLQDMGILYLSAPKVQDVAPLAAMTKLYRLTLSKAQLADYAQLGRLASLTNLSLSESTGVDVSFAKDLPKLGRLSLGDTDVTSLEPLANLGSIETVNLIGTQNLDVLPLMSLPALKQISLTNTTARGVEQFKAERPTVAVFE